MIRKEKLDKLNEHYEELKTIKFEKLLTSKFIKGEAYECTLNNGIVIRRDKLIKGNKDGSACIIMPITKDGEILMVVEPRVFTKDTVALGFPAGYIEKGEKPIDAAIRELREETGYVSNNLVEIDSFYQDEGCSGAFNHIFIAFDCDKQHDQQLDKYEVVRYMTFNYDELFELEKLGYIISSNAKLTLYKSIPYMKGDKNEI